MGVSKRLRYEILSRDGFTCRYCGATDVPLHVERHLPIAREWRNSIRSMLARGMDLEILKHCVRIAMEASVADKWPYFCGVAWRTLDRAEAIAKGGE